jgi:hypothetical protein
MVDIIDQHWWCDTTLVTGANDGTSPANAWQNIQTAMEYNAFSSLARNIVNFRRISYHLMVSDINMSDDGFANKPIIFRSWPRDNKAITDATWTKGSTAVSNVNGFNATREKHCGRFILAPDGRYYLLTLVSGPNDIVIDRPYAGASVSGVSGAATVLKDEWFDDRHTDGISAGWDSDANDLCRIDGNLTDYLVLVNSDYYYGFQGFDFYNLADTINGTLQFTNGKACLLEGSLIKSSANETMVLISGDTHLYINRLIMEGSQAGSNQRGLYTSTNGRVTMRNSAIYGMGDNGTQFSTGEVYLENVNIGVEIPNGDADIRIFDPTIIKGIDVKLGGTNGYLSLEDLDSLVIFDNYNKELGRVFTGHEGGRYQSVDVTTVTPNKKLSDYVLEITPDGLATNAAEYAEKPVRKRINLATIELDSGATEIKYWLYNDLGIIINGADSERDIYLEASYVNGYDALTRYTRKTINSTQKDIYPAGDFLSTIWDADASVFTSGTYSWIAYGTNTITNVANELEIAYVNNPGGAYVHLADAKDLTEDLVIGQTYLLTLDAYFIGGTGIPSIRVNVIPTEIYLPIGMGAIKTTYAIVFTATTVSTNYLSMAYLSPGMKVYYDNIKLQKINANLDDWDYFTVDLNPAVRSLVDINMVISMSNVNSVYLEPQYELTI